MTVNFAAKGDPQGKGRPRFNRNGAVYTPEKTAHYCSDIGVAKITKRIGCVL